MKIYTIKLALSGLAATLALVVPGIGWAGDHYLGLTNVTNNIATNIDPSTSCTSGIPDPTALADKAIVSGGVLSTTDPLTLRALCNGDGAATIDVDFTGTLTPVTRQVKMCKNWTVKGGAIVYGWLDQGLTNIGVSGTLTSGNFRVELTMGTPGTVSTEPGTCTAANQGAYDYTVTRSAEVYRDDDAAKLLATANFTFGNTAPQGSVPEPGTLSLIGLGLAGLGWMGARRARKSRAVAA